MMQAFRFLLVALLSGTTLLGCGGSSAPKPLSADQERQVQEQLQKARQAEGAAQKPTR